MLGLITNLLIESPIEQRSLGTMGSLHRQKKRKKVAINSIIVANIVLMDCDGAFFRITY